MAGAPSHPTLTLHPPCLLLPPPAAASSDEEPPPARRRRTAAPQEEDEAEAHPLLAKVGEHGAGSGPLLVSGASTCSQLPPEWPSCLAPNERHLPHFPSPDPSPLPPPGAPHMRPQAQLAVRWLHLRGDPPWPDRRSFDLPLPCPAPAHALSKGYSDLHAAGPLVPSLPWASGCPFCEQGARPAPAQRPSRLRRWPGCLEAAAAVTYRPAVPCCVIPLIY